MRVRYFSILIIWFALCHGAFAHGKGKEVFYLAPLSTFTASELVQYEGDQGLKAKSSLYRSFQSFIAEKISFPILFKACRHYIEASFWLNYGSGPYSLDYYEKMKSRNKILIKMMVSRITGNRYSFLELPSYSDKIGRSAMGIYYEIPVIFKYAGMLVKVKDNKTGDVAYLRTDCYSRDGDEGQDKGFRKSNVDVARKLAVARDKSLFLRRHLPEIEFPEYVDYWYTAKSKGDIPLDEAVRDKRFSSLDLIEIGIQAIDIAKEIKDITGLSFGDQRLDQYTVEFENNRPVLVYVDFGFEGLNHSRELKYFLLDLVEELKKGGIIEIETLEALEKEVPFKTVADFFLSYRNSVLERRSEVLVGSPPSSMLEFSA